MTPAVRIIRSAARAWEDEQLSAPGRGRLTVLSLEREIQDRQTFLDVVRSARTNNAVFLRRYIQHRNRGCLHAIHPDTFKGAGFDMWSCLGSDAQRELREYGDRVVDHYEENVEYEEDPDPDQKTWALSAYLPRGRELVAYSHAAHPHYSTADMNQLERRFAAALDSVGTGVWARNPATPSVGFSIPLLSKVGDSSRFYPDFLWGVREGLCWAIDPTGQHLVDAKIRGKLVALDNPKVALVTPGRWDLAVNGTTSDAGWSVLRARPALPAVVHTYDSPEELLVALAG